MFNDLVSVIISSYNRCFIVGNAIKSVLEQVYTNIELIIIDDCSNDKTKDIVCEFIKKDSRVKYFRNEINLGPAGSRNIGMKKSIGKYIAFLDSDDVWLENHLIESINVLKKEKSLVSFSFWYEKNENGDVKKFFNKELFEDVINTQKPTICDNYYKFENSFFEYAITNSFYCYHINTLVINRSVINEVGMFNEKLRASEDIDFSLRLIEKYGFCLINNFHFIYCKGNDNLYWFIDRSCINLKEILKNFELIQKLSFCNKYKCEMLKFRKKIVLKSNNVKNKHKCIKECNTKISRKYYAIAFLNKGYNIRKSFVDILMSLKYDFNLINLKLLLILMIPWKRKKFIVDRIDIF